MIAADYNDKKKVVDILTESFNDNKSVNYVIKQDAKRIERIKKLMEYSFDVCFEAGSIMLSEDKYACALVFFPNRKRSTLTSVIRDVSFLFSCVGTTNIVKVLRRESRIKKIRPKGNIWYLWFLGVHPSEQGKGTGTKLLRELIQMNKSSGLPICLETSNSRNLPFYTRAGFIIYHKLNLDYDLFCLKHPAQGRK